LLKIGVTIWFWGILLFCIGLIVVLILYNAFISWRITFYCSLVDYWRIGLVIVFLVSNGVTSYFWMLNWFEMGVIEGVTIDKGFKTVVLVWDGFWELIVSLGLDELYVWIC
jgi:hypothetical protein